ncbi:MAG: hypothetical protein FWD71_02195, partial [Oscillospiraceae bacterium]|nr:hypothetical protein [Oscillospiraceae bacterium]
PAIPLMQNAVKFLENNVGDDGACASVSANATENSNSTAVALSALVGYYNDDGSANENIKKVIGGLDIFKLTTVAGYSYLKDGLSANVLSTSQAAIALGDLKDKTSVWQKLYSDSVTAFANNPNSAGSASD